MKRLFIIAISAATFAGCTSSNDYSSVSEPVSGPRPLDPIVSTPRNWNKPVKTLSTARVNGEVGTRSIQGTSWERSWHDTDRD
jgi:hypothetical protein